MLSIGDAFLFHRLAHAEEIADSVTACAVKNNILCGIHTDRKVLDLNCHFYVVKATLENKCMPCFQDYDYIVRKGAEKIIKRRRPHRHRK